MINSFRKTLHALAGIAKEQTPRAVAVDKLFNERFVIRCIEIGVFTQQGRNSIFFHRT